MRATVFLPDILTDHALQHLVPVFSANSLQEIDARLKALVRRSHNEYVEYVLSFNEPRHDNSTQCACSNAS
jgi:hypothetical protein